MAIIEEYQEALNLLNLKIDKCLNNKCWDALTKVLMDVEAAEAAIVDMHHYS